MPQTMLSAVFVLNFMSMLIRIALKWYLNALSINKLNMCVLNRNVAIYKWAAIDNSADPKNVSWKLF